MINIWKERIEMEREHDPFKIESCASKIYTKCLGGGGLGVHFAGATWLEINYFFVTFAKTGSPNQVTHIPTPGKKPPRPRGRSFLRPRPLLCFLESFQINPFVPLQDERLEGVPLISNHIDVHAWNTTQYIKNKKQNKKKEFELRSGGNF